MGFGGSVLNGLRNLLFGSSGSFPLSLPGLRLDYPFQVLEAVCWLALAVAATRYLVGRWRRSFSLPPGGLSLLLLAAGPRLLAPWVTYNWYFGAGNIPFGPGVAIKSTTCAPLWYRVVGFDLGLGFSGLVGVNLLLGTASVLLLWRLARRVGIGDRSAWWLAVLVAVLPMYVRLAASDTAQVTILFFWLLAASAMASLRRGAGGWPAHVTLFAAIVIGCPIRLESAAMFPALVAFVGQDMAGWGEMRRQWRRYGAAWAGLAVGLTAALAWHGGVLPGMAEDVAGMLGIVLPLLVPAALLKTFAAFNLSALQYLPILLTIPIAREFAACWRAGDRRVLLSAFGPSLLFAAAYPPMIFLTDLSSSSYYVVYLLLPLTNAARGLVRLVDDVREGQLLVGRASRVLAFASAPLLLWAFFLVPGRASYVFEQEAGFLDRNLPSGPATVLALWDDDSVAGRWDCSMALPYPPLMASHPEVRWIILDASEASRERLGSLVFTHYYPGTLVRLDPETRLPWPVREFATPEDEWRRDLDRARLWRLRDLDQQIRARFPLEILSRDEARAVAVPGLGRGCTGLNFGFPDPEVELVLYRRAG